MTVVAHHSKALCLEVGIKWGSGMLTFVFTEGSRVALYLPGLGHIRIGSMTIGMSLYGSSSAWV